MGELADPPSSKVGAEMRVGSTPTSATKFKQGRKMSTYLLLLILCTNSSCNKFNIEEAPIYYDSLSTCKIAGKEFLSKNVRFTCLKKCEYDVCITDIKAVK